MNVFQNRTSNNSTKADPLDEPLLVDLEVVEDGTALQQCHSPRNPAVTKEFAMYGMLLGCCVGSLLHLATLGGSFVMLANLGVDASSSRAKMVALGMSFAISLLAVTLSAAVRSLLGIALRARDETMTTPSDNDLAYVRHCNLLGLVTGIFFASGATELLMDWNSYHVLLHGLSLCVWVATALLVCERKYSDLEKTTI
jgi:hypothetical protein